MDLTAINGIGSKLAERLNAAGITNVAELAAATDEQLEAIEGMRGARGIKLRLRAQAAVEALDKGAAGEVATNDDDAADDDDGDDSDDDGDDSDGSDDDSDGSDDDDDSDGSDDDDDAADDDSDDSDDAADDDSDDDDSDDDDSDDDSFGDRWPTKAVEHDSDIRYRPCLLSSDPGAHPLIETAIGLWNHDPRWPDIFALATDDTPDIEIRWAPGEHALYHDEGDGSTVLVLDPGIGPHPLAQYLGHCLSVPHDREAPSLMAGGPNADELDLEAAGKALFQAQTWVKVQAERANRKG
jgi:hypothetical protein